MAVEIRAATYAALRTALAAGTYQAGQMVFCEEPGAHFQVKDNSGATYTDDGVRVITGGGFAATVLAGSAVLTSGGSLLGNAQDTIDDVWLSVLLTAPSDNFPSGIGDTSAVTGAASSHSDSSVVDADHDVPWGDDSSYVPGSADIALIIGGYDHRCNQLAGAVIGGGHNVVRYNVNGHSIIAGGSNNRISAGRAGIFHGLNNSIIGSGDYASVVGGSKCLIDTGQASAVVGGFQNYIKNTGWSGIFSGYQNQVLGASHYSGVLAGHGNVINGAEYGAAIAGKDGEVLSSGMVVQGGGQLTLNGDAQSVRFVWRYYSNNSTTLANMTGPGGFLELPDSGTTVLTGRFYLTAMDIATKDTAAFVYEGSIKWDGTTGVCIDSGGSGAERAFTQMHDAITVTTVPVMACNTGSVRPKFAGKTGATIKVACAFDGVMTRI